MSSLTTYTTDARVCGRKRKRTHTYMYIYIFYVYIYIYIYIYIYNLWESNHRNGPTGHKNNEKACRVISNKLKLGWCMPLQQNNLHTLTYISVAPLCFAVLMWSCYVEVVFNYAFVRYHPNLVCAFSVLTSLKFFFIIPLNVGCLYTSVKNHFEYQTGIPENLNILLL